MNWLKLKVDGRFRLFNIELVKEVQDNKPYGCVLHYGDSEPKIIDETFE